MVEPGQKVSGKTLEHYNLTKVLGDGNFGAAYLATDSRDNSQVAVKVFKGLDPQTEKTFTAEVLAAEKGMDHENVLTLSAAGRSSVMQNGEPVSDVFYIVSELAVNGESFDYVEAAGGLSDRQSRQVFGQICAGVHHIHEHGVAHRDLKLENVFLDENAMAKVADFGLNKVFDGPDRQALTTNCGTVNYMGPEIGSGKEYDGPAADIFALGAILFIMRTARFAFGSAGDAWYKKLQSDPMRYMKKRQLIDYDPDFIDLVANMTMANPQSRLSLRQVFKHPFMIKEAASKEEVRAHFYEVMPKKKAITEAHYKAQQDARRQWANYKGIERAGEEEPEPWQIEAESILEWSEYTHDYKDYDESKFNSKVGFFSDSIAEHILAKVWEIYKKAQYDGKIPEDLIEDPQVDSQVWKMTFKAHEPVCEAFEADEEDEDEDEEEISAAMNSADVTVTVRAVQRQEGSDLPKKTYVAFKYKGNNQVFGNLRKKFFSELEMFMSEGNEVQE